MISPIDRLDLSDKARPAYGHAKNKRCDLKQMTLLLATAGKSGFPVWMESHSGNASDKKTLEEAASRMQKFCNALADAPATLLYVGDSAMYANAVKQSEDLLIKKLKYHPLQYCIERILKHKTQGRPKKSENGSQSEKIVTGYGLKSRLISDEEAIAKVKLSKGRFILATNQLDKLVLSDDAILSTYKEQSGTESGFKFIKDDAFEVDSIFLKKPGRISALMMVMTLCLMVYGFSQYFLREQLKRYSDTLPSQSGRETDKPSMKWIYRLFHGVHVLKISNNTIKTRVLNVNDLLEKIIRYFGQLACRIYNIQENALGGFHDGNLPA